MRVIVGFSRFRILAPITIFPVFTACVMCIWDTHIFFLDSIKIILIAQPQATLEIVLIESEVSAYAKFCEKCPCLHNNNSTVITQISLETVNIGSISCVHFHLILVVIIIIIILYPRGKALF